MKENKKGLPAKAGFTLIELLVVIAVLGTLAVVVLLALNPVQQLARTRDAGRSSGVTQLGHAMEAYGTVNNGQYPQDGATCAQATWVDTCLVDSGEIQTVPSAIAYSSLSASPGSCGGVAEQSWCYDGTNNAFVVYTAAEADSNTNKCTAGVAYFVYSSAAGQGGTWCGGSPPAAGLTGTDAGWVN